MITLDPTILTTVSHIVTHADCADGIASAMILHDAIPDAEVTFLHYESPEHARLKARSGMLFCDMTPPRERVAEFVESGAVVLDHHLGARDLVEAFGERGVYADEPGVSGAVLAYRRVWFPIRGVRNEALHRAIQKLAGLAGIRDTWRRESKWWGEACAQAAALRFWPWERLHRAIGEGVMDDLLAVGPVLLAALGKLTPEQLAKPAVWWSTSASAMVWSPAVRTMATPTSPTATSSRGCRPARRS